MIKSLIYMLPFVFLMGVLGRFFLVRTLNAEPKTTLKTRIKRDYFDVVPNEKPDREHKPDDDTHSVILEAVEKRLWKISIFDNDDGDLLELLLHKKWAAVLLMILVSLMGIVNELADKPQEFSFAWEEKLDAMIDPYKIQIFTGIIILCVAWFIWSWLAKRLRLLKDVRSRNYDYKLIMQEKPRVSADGVLEVTESNAQEDCIRLEIYFNENYWHHRHFAGIELMVERQDLQS